MRKRGSSTSTSTPRTSHAPATPVERTVRREQATRNAATKGAHPPPPPSRERQDDATGARERAERPALRLPPTTRETRGDQDGVTARVAALLQAERYGEAHALIEEACQREPARESYRRMALRVCAEGGLGASALAHAEWLMLHHAQSRAHAAVCELYQFLLELNPSAPFQDRVLGLSVVAANACGDGAMVVDATRRLMRDHPRSAHLPNALLVTARHQLSEGRPELARATLTHLASRYGESPASAHARRMLADFTALSTFGTHE